MKRTITQDDIIYFIVTDRFFGKSKSYTDQADRKIHGGTLDGIIEKLDYISQLGITAIWITPVYENVKDFFGSEPYHYYWANDFTKIDGRLLDGSHLPQSTDRSTLAAFIAKCEQKGIKVILDMVVNHAGYGAEHNFPASWFNNGTSGEIKKPLDGLPDFNHDNPEVLDYFIGHIQAWIKDGTVNNIRMDTVKHVEPKFWHYFKYQIRGQYPEVNLLGEVLCEDKADIPKLLDFQNFHDFDSIFDFPLAKALRDTLVYDGNIKEHLARPRIHEDEPMGVLDHDNPFKGGYRNANELVTLLDNHDLQRRIMSHARTKHSGTGEGFVWAIRITKLCLGALFTIRGVPQLYYGTELGLEGWKSESGDHDMRRDFPWQVIGEDNYPLPQAHKESEIYQWTRDLIQLRKKNEAFRYGTTLTLWSDNFVYAFLRVSLDEVALVIINNGYSDMAYPIRLSLNDSLIPERVIKLVKTGLRHWKSGQPVTIENNQVALSVGGKTIEIFCQSPV